MIVILEPNECGNLVGKTKVYEIRQATIKIILKVCKGSRQFQRAARASSNREFSNLSKLLENKARII